MEPHIFILILLLGSLAFAIIKQLLTVAVIIIAVAFAYYTGLAQAFFDVILPYIAPLLPESFEVAAIILPFL